MAWSSASASCSVIRSLKCHSHILNFKNFTIKPSNICNFRSFPSFRLLPLYYQQQRFTNTLNQEEHDRQEVESTKSLNNKPIFKSSTTKKPKKKKSISQNAGLLEYVNSQPFVTNSSTVQTLLTKSKFVKVKRNLKESLYLINEEVGQILASLFQPYMPNKNATIIEFNPGFGLLTNELKKLGFANINCFEDNEELIKFITTNQTQTQTTSSAAAASAMDPGLNIIQTNMMTFPRLYHLDKLDNGIRIVTALNSIKTKQNDDLYVIGATPTIDFINFTIKCLVTQKIVFDDEINDWNINNITFLLALGTRPFTIINSTSELGFSVYRASTILFQVLFHYVLLGNVPRKAFVPWEAAETGSAANGSTGLDDDLLKMKKLRKPTIPHDPEIMSIIKFTPNQQNITKIGKSNLFHFWYFVRHHLFARTNCVIPELEQWIPGCGPRLIRKGYTIFTKFGSLTPQQILELFLDFSSWPEFQSCSFLNAMEKYQHKMESQEEDILRIS